MTGTARLPESGRSWEEIERELQSTRDDDLPWRSGRTTRAAFHASEEVAEIGRRAFDLFISENALYINQMPSLNRMQQEVLSMAAHLLGGGEATAGTMTHGGTESIFVACLAAREWARQEGRLSERSRIVVPRSAHPSFNKAAFYLGLELVRVPLGENHRADVAAMETALDDAIMMVGSAPCWPYGLIDPIEELASLAASRGLWFHVDACVGGFVAPFVRQLGYPVPAFDFAVPGVWSLSADVHKYGYAPKGASVVLFRDRELPEFARFTFDDWPTGLYSTAAFLGTRNGGTIAGAWAVMNALGQEGYRRFVKVTMDAKLQLMDAIAEIDGLYVLGAPEVTLISYGADGMDVAALAEALTERDWIVSRCKEPPLVQMTLNPVHAPAMLRYVEDLRAAVAEVRGGRVAAATGPVTYAS